MQEWRIAAGSLTEKLHEQGLDTIVKGGPIRAEYYATSRAQEPERKAALREEWLRTRKPLTRTARKLLDLHNEYVRLIADQLQPLAGESLREAFHRIAFAPFFPDPCDLTAMFDATEALELEAEQRAALAELRLVWQADASLALGQALKSYLEWREYTCLNSGYEQVRYAEYSKSMSADMDARLLRSETALESVLALLNEEQRKVIQADIGQWRKGVLEFKGRRKAVGERYNGWPEPYD